MTPTPVLVITCPDGSNARMALNPEYAEMVITTLCRVFAPDLLREVVWSVEPDSYVREAA